MAVIIRIWLRNDSEYGLGAADAALGPRDCIASVVSAVASLEISLLCEDFMMLHPVAVWYRPSSLVALRPMAIIRLEDGRDV